MRRFTSRSNNPGCFHTFNSNEPTQQNLDCQHSNSMTAHWVQNYMRSKSYNDDPASEGTFVLSGEACLYIQIILPGMMMFHKRITGKSGSTSLILFQ